MNIRKSLAYKRNIRMELKRQYNDLSKSLIKEKQVTAQLQSYDVLPEDLRESLMTFHEKSIVNTEKVRDSGLSLWRLGDGLGD